MSANTHYTPQPPPVSSRANPYESPAAELNSAGSPTKSDTECSTLRRAIIQGMRRGAKIGAMGGLVFTIVVLVLLFAFVDRPDNLDTVSGWVELVGTLSLVMLGYTVLGAVMGALIMAGLGALTFRTRRSPK